MYSNFFDACPSFCNPLYRIDKGDTHFFASNNSCMATAADIDKLMTLIQENKPIQHTLDREFENNEAKFVVFHTDIDGKSKKFVLKQQRPTASSWIQYTLILEAVASRIAEELEVPVNHVRILPPCSSFALTPYPHLPATIHTYIEGEADSSLNIMQNTRKGTKTEDRGLTLEVIQNMAKNKSLPLIVGFDTAIGNTDRHWNNIRYCPSTNQYIGLDHGDIFRPIVKVAIDRVKELIAKKTTLAPDILESLKEYRNTLLKFYKNYPIDKIYQYLDEATQTSKLDQYGALFKESEVTLLKDYQKENINLMPDLIKHIDALIALEGETVPSFPTAPVYHVVQKGDSLWKISRMYHVPIADIVKANNIQDANQIFIGQRLLIPDSSMSTVNWGRGAYPTHIPFCIFE